MFWQLTIDANDPALLARFWAQALGLPAGAAGRAGHALEPALSRPGNEFCVS